MRDELTLPRLLTKQEVLVLVPVTFPYALGVDQKIPSSLSSPAHHRLPAHVARKRSGRVDHHPTNAILQTLKSRGISKC
jgi:hypothetical protein